LELSQKYSRDLFIFVNKYGKQQKKFLGQVTVHAFPGQELYKGPNFFFKIWGLWVSKDADFNEISKILNLPYSDKMHLKMLFEI
jgi:hypothetical protein